MMLVPHLDTRIDRRILINFRLDPAIARTLVPAPLTPEIVDGSSVAGVCLIRLQGLRPTGSPIGAPWIAENAAHRIAVTWDGPNGPERGVYVPERRSSSRAAQFAGDRIFPGVHRHADFTVNETARRLSVAMSAGDMSVTAEVEPTTKFASGLFADLETVSEFFRGGDVAWSPRRDGRTLDGLRLEARGWSMEPARAIEVHSALYDALPAGSAVLDSVLLMRDIPVTWHSAGRLRTTEVVAA